MKQNRNFSTQMAGFFFYAKRSICIFIMALLTLPSLNAQRSYLEMIRSAMNVNTTSSFNNGDKYKGQISGGNRKGLGVYRFNDGDVYFGQWNNNQRSGTGVYIIGDAEKHSISNCPGCVFFVGEWANNEKMEGVCYDKTGKVIYIGKFKDGKPVDTYPKTGYDKYNFKIIKNSDDSYYVGETTDGEREGLGIFLWTGGGMWYGYWADGKRSGEGLEMHADGTITAGTWVGNTYYAGTEVGKKFLDIKLKTPDDRSISISDYAGKGKYVLLDFWASWCGPCRRANPDMVELYRRHKSKGFEIIGISLDQNKESWVKAIKDDNLTWPQMSDLGFWNSEAAKIYGVRSIPHSILLDKNGIIIAKGHFYELTSKIAEIFN